MNQLVILATIKPFKIHTDIWGLGMDHFMGYGYLSLTKSEANIYRR